MFLFIVYDRSFSAVEATLKVFAAVMIREKRKSSQKITMSIRIIEKKMLLT